MGHAHRIDAPDGSQAPNSRCLLSPHCGLPASVRRRFGGLGGFWLHYGPIGKLTTPLILHGDDPLGPGPVDAIYDAETCPDWRAHDGAHADLFCLPVRPGPGARRHGVTTVHGTRRTVWRVYSTAWRDPDGPRVVWKAPGFGLSEEGWHTVSATRPTAALSEELRRLEDLLEGRGPRRGRRRREEDPSWREVAARAVSRKQAYPSLPWDDIARAMGVSSRALRDYRRILRREDEDGRGVYLLDGGDER